MGFSGSRSLFHRLLLLPPLIFLTLTCIYTPSTLWPLSSKRRSFSPDVHCLACENPASRSFLSLANFPTSSYIKDVILRQNVLKIDNSREIFKKTDSRNGRSDRGHSRFEVEEGNIMELGHSLDTMDRIRKDEMNRMRPPREENPEFELSTPKFIPVDDEEPIREEREEESPLLDGDRLTLEEADNSRSGRYDVEERLAVDAVDQAVEDRLMEMRHLTSDTNVLLRETPEMINEGDTNVAMLIQESPISETEEPEFKFGYDDMPEDLRLAGIAVEKLMDTITESGLPRADWNYSSGTGDDVILDSNLIFRRVASQGLPMKDQGTCDGRRIFVYDLPSKFNAELVGQCDTLLNWFNFCDYFMNEGMGLMVPTDELNERGERVLVPDGSWYLTHQYALEIIFHARLKHYPCLTNDMNEASLFFIPYYAGLDVIRWHFMDNVTNDRRDELTKELMSWLETQESWQRNGGLDHVLVLGKIGWDFCRPSDHVLWGSDLLLLPSMASTMKLLIERNPWHPNDVGVPHPTFFHPKDDDEIRGWLEHAEQSERRHLVSFAGMPRPNMLGNIRGHLIQQCLEHSNDCFLLRCERNLCLRPDSTMNLFLHSHFCLQPPGDSPTRRSVFDSLIGGCIPVLFDPYTAYYQYAWHLPRNASSYSVFIPSSHVMEGKADIVEILRNITKDERTAMRTRIIHEIIPGLLYSKPGTNHSDFRDAFDISIQALLNRVANLRAEHELV